MREPEQTTRLRSYWNPYDLSARDVAPRNVAETSPLRSATAEILEIPGYTRKEKLDIASSRVPTSRSTA